MSLKIDEIKSCEEYIGSQVSYWEFSLQQWHLPEMYKPSIICTGDA